MFYSTYKRDKFRTRIERGTEPGTVEIFVSHRGMEQVPTAKIDNVQGAAFAWAVMPPNPKLEAEMLSRLMMRFGTPEAQAVALAVAGRRRRRAAFTRALEKSADGPSKLVVDDPFDRAWRRVGPGARPHRLHRRRPRSLDRRLLRPLRRSRRRHGEEGQREGLPVAS